MQDGNGPRQKRCRGALDQSYQMMIHKTRNEDRAHRPVRVRHAEVVEWGHNIKMRRQKRCRKDVRRHCAVQESQQSTVRPLAHRMLYPPVHRH